MQRIRALAEAGDYGPWHRAWIERYETGGARSDKNNQQPTTLRPGTRAKVLSLVTKGHPYRSAVDAIPRSFSPSRMAMKLADVRLAISDFRSQVDEDGAIKQHADVGLISAGLSADISVTPDRLPSESRKAPPDNRPGPFIGEQTSEGGGETFFSALSCG